VREMEDDVLFSLILQSVQLPHRVKATLEPVWRIAWCIFVSLLPLPWEGHECILAQKGVRFREFGRSS